MNYIGSKYSLIQNISALITEHIPIQGKALDLFCGTSTVAQQLKLLGFETYANDWQYYSFVTASSYLNFDQYPQFSKLMASSYINLGDQNYISSTVAQTTIHSVRDRGKDNLLNNASKVLRHLEHLEGQEGSFFDQYCEGGSQNRQYYSQANGKKIQAIGDQIDQWNKAGLLSQAEHHWLRASLVESADRVANTASVYGAFLKRVKKSAQKPLKMIALAPIPSAHPDHRHKAFCHDASTIFKDHNLPHMTLTYLDPPYNHRQYSGNYHILETLARWDLSDFEPRGKTGLRKADEHSSPFCSRVKAQAAFKQLFASLKTKYVLFSYNNEGLLSEKELEELFEIYCSDVQVFKLNYGRFRADNDGEHRNYSSNSVEEFLILGRYR